MRSQLLTHLDWLSPFHSRERRHSQQHSSLTDFSPISWPDYRDMSIVNVSAGAVYLKIPATVVTIHVTAIAMKNTRNSSLIKRSKTPSHLGVSQSFA
jgi:hypothetical protein